tara:strand:- start:7622 stop:8686 length:1065 start_codon:yes stop_codon:yes gene_type:complete
MSENETPEPVVKKKRGRKKKSELEQIAKENENKIEEAPVPKKRGRKPKGGKLTIKPILLNDDVNQTTNIILHLKCSMKDIENNEINKNHILSDPLSYKPMIPPNIMTYDNSEREFFNYNGEEQQNNLAYDSVNEKSNKNKDNLICPRCQNDINDKDKYEDVEDTINIKDINSKLKSLKLQLYKDSNPDKKSACFWCTYEFDNPCCYIPKYETDENTSGYGSFCRPECAVAYLMKENIDDSAKFERYQLLNKIYGKVYNYTKNIRPAPNPYYLLDKYYGNLTIQEYRKLMKSEHMLLILEKPLTRILPELHEDLEDSNNFNTGNNMNGYKVKRQSEKQKGPSKNEIIKESFGFTQ